MKINKAAAKGLASFILVITAFFGINILFDSSKDNSEKKEIQKNEKVWTVQAKSFYKVNEKAQIKLLGKIDSLWNSTLSSPQQGHIIKVNVQEGDIAEKGQSLIQIDNRDIELKIQQAEADLNSAQANSIQDQNNLETQIKAMENEKELLNFANNEYQRAIELKKVNSISETKFDKAKSDLERQELAIINRQQAIDQSEARVKISSANIKKAKASLDRLLLDQDKMNMKAPFNAKISKVLTSPGQQIFPNVNLVEVYDLDNMVLYAQIPTKYLAEIRDSMMNDGVWGTISHLGKKYDIELISLAGKSQFGGLRATFKIHNADANLVKGTVTEAISNLSLHQNVFKIPKTALYQNDQIFTIVNKRIKTEKITLMGHDFRQKTPHVLVKAPKLENNTKILTKLLPNLIDGLKVKVERVNINLDNSSF